MRILISGVAGFIGSAIARQALASGHSVTGCDNLDSYYDTTQKRANLKALERHGGRAEMVVGDLRDFIREHEVSQFDVVFHEAGQPGVRASWGHDFAQYLDANVLLTQCLLEAARAARRPPRIVLASSSSVYGNARAYPVSEESETRPFSPYGVSKLAGERLALAYAENFGISVTALRYFTVYGPGQRPDMAIHRLVRAALEGTEFAIFGDGTQVRDFTYVDDVVAANMAAATAESLGPVALNVCGGEKISMRDVIQVVEEVCGKSIKLRIGEAMAGDVRETSGDPSAAAERLGWRPNVSFAEGVAAEAEWMRAALGRA